MQSLMMSSLLTIVLFVATGVLTPMMIELISTNGGSEKSTLLIALPACIGMSFSIFTNWKSVNKGVIQWKLIISIACVDMLSQILIFNGLILAGSGIFTVVYSSVTIYIAILSYFVLNRQLQMGQWIGLFVVVLGLSVVAIGAREEGKDVLLGVVLIMIGAFIHSVTYVLSECLLVFCKNPISPELLCTLMGTIGGGVNIIWQVLYTLPRYQTLLVDEVASKQGSATVIIVAYIVMIFTGLVHGICFFHLLSMLGSTATGLIKGIQSVMIFVVSHFAFCSIQQSQCFSLIKGVSLVLVLLGVYLYTVYQPVDDTSHNSHDGVKTVMHSSLRLNAYLPIYDRIEDDADDLLLGSNSTDFVTAASQLQSIGELATSLSHDDDDDDDDHNALKRLSYQQGGSVGTTIELPVRNTLHKV